MKGTDTVFTAQTLRWHWHRGLAIVAAIAIFGAAPADAASAEPGPIPAGANLPFVSLEAEDATTTGDVIGPDYTQGTVASEASGRQAVRLDDTGDHVEFTVPVATNAITVNVNIPDGQSGTLSVYADGTKLGTPLNVTSRYSYMNTPWIAGSTTHHLFDSSRLLLGVDLAPGDTLRIQVDAEDTAGPYTIDLVDVEHVDAPAAQPANSLSVVETGADPTGTTDSWSAFDQAIQLARADGREVWIPEGEFLVGNALFVDNIVIRGAGAWHSVVHSSRFINQGDASGRIGLHDFAVIGDVTERVDSDPDNFVNGSLGVDSHVSGMWIQHLKVGLWLTGVNTGLVVEDNRFLDLAADGLNVNGTAQDSVVRHNYLRNTGDDALAMWSLHSPNLRNSFVDNTIVQPNLANGIAIYGGTDITVTGNLIRDTNALGSGIAISNQRFAEPFFPLSGTITVSGNTLERTGAMNPNWNHPMSALRVDAYDSSTDGAQIVITDTTIIDSPWSAIQFVSGSGTGQAVRNVTIDGATIDGVGSVVIQAETTGEASIANVTATNVDVAGIYNCPFPTGAPPFDLALGGGNSGFDTVWEDCTTWPGQD